MIYNEMLSPGYRRPLQPFQSHLPCRNVFCLLPSNKKLSWQIFLIFAREDAPLLVLSLSKTATAYLSIIFDASITPLNEVLIFFFRYGMTLKTIAIQNFSFLLSARKHLQYRGIQFVLLTFAKQNLTF